MPLGADAGDRAAFTSLWHGGGCPRRGGTNTVRKGSHVTTVLLVVLLAAATVVLALARLLRSPAAAEDQRFHRAAQLTSQWARGEQPPMPRPPED